MLHTVKDFRPIFSRVRQKALFKVGPHPRPLCGISLHIGRRSPAMLEIEVIWECFAETVNKYFKKLGLKATDGHKTSAFAGIYIVERCTTVKRIGPGLSSSEYRRGREDMMKQRESGDKTGTTNL
jgi:hypothetical protein